MLKLMTIINEKKNQIREVEKRTDLFKKLTRPLKHFFAGWQEKRKSCAKKKVSFVYANFFSCLSNVIRALHASTSASRSVVANHCNSAFTIRKASFCQLIVRPGRPGSLNPVQKRRRRASADPE